MAKQRLPGQLVLNKHENRPSYDMDQTCYINHLQQFSYNISLSIRKKVISSVSNIGRSNTHTNGISFLNHAIGKRSLFIMRKLKSVDDLDEETLYSLSMKSASLIQDKLMDTGLLMSSQDDFSGPFNNISQFREVVVNNIISISDMEKVTIEIYPKLEWPLPLFLTFITPEESLRQSSYYEFWMGSIIFNILPLCQQVPRLSLSKKKCISKIMLIEYQNSELCGIIIKCDTQIDENLICSSNKRRCEIPKVMTNFKISGDIHLYNKIRKGDYNVIDLSKATIIEQFPEYRICSIDKLKIKNSDCITQQHYFGEVQFSLYQNGTLIISPISINSQNSIRFNSSKIENYYCNDFKCLDELDEIRCTGDKEFCKNIRECYPGSENKCGLMKNHMSYYDRNNNSNSQILSIIKWARIGINTNVTAEDFDIETVKFDGEVLYFQKGCVSSAQCSNGVVHLNSSCEIMKVIIKLNRKMFIIDEFKMHSNGITLPFNIVKGGVPAILSVYGKYGMIIREYLNCDETNPCLSINCFMCLKKLVNPMCLTEDEKLIIVISIILLICLIGVVLLITLYLKKDAKRIMIHGRDKLVDLSKRAYNKAKTFKNRRFKQEDQDETTMIQSDVITNESSDTTINGDRPVKPLVKKMKEFNYTNLSNSPRKRLYDMGTPILITFLIIMSYLASTHACSDSTTLKSESKDCEVTPSGKLYCKIKTSIRISGPPSGQQTCINMKSNPAVVDGYMSIKTLAQYYQCNKNHLYYTFQSGIVTRTINACPGTQHCESRTECTRFLNSTEKQREIFPNIINKLSVQDCTTPNGCAGNGCWRCDSGCSYISNEFINKDGNVYEVLNCPTWTPRLSIEIKFHGIQNYDDFNLSLTGDNPQTAQGLKFSLVSRSSPPSNLDFCILRNERDSYLTSCQPTTQISGGSIGEIRCPSQMDAHQATDKCIISKSVVDIKPANWEFVTCNKQIDIKTAISRGKLPSNFGVNLIDSLNDGTYTLQGTEGELFEIQIDIDDATVEFRREKNTCFAKDVEIKGCYSCETGATLTTEVWSDIDNSMALMDCEGLNPLPLSIGREKKIFNKTVFFTNKMSSVTCTFICSLNKVEVISKVSLKEQILLNVIKDDIIVSKVTGSRTSFSSFFRDNMWSLIPSITLGSALLIVSAALISCKIIQKASNYINPMIELQAPILPYSKQK